MKILKDCSDLVSGCEASCGKKEYTISINPTTSNFSYLLYELNGWIGGPSDRVLVIKSLAQYQPSFDGLWECLLSTKPSLTRFPIVLVYDVHHYELMDQLSETMPQMLETQKLLGCLSLAVVGGCNVRLASKEIGNQIEFSDDVVSLYSHSEEILEIGKEILQKYG